MSVRVQYVNDVRGGRRQTSLVGRQVRCTAMVVILLLRMAIN